MKPEDLSWPTVRFISFKEFLPAGFVPAFQSGSIENEIVSDFLGVNYCSGVVASSRYQSKLPCLTRAG